MWDFAFGFVTGITVVLLLTTVVLLSIVLRIGSYVSSQKRSANSPTKDSPVGVKGA